MTKKTLPADVLKSLGVTDKPTGSSVAKEKSSPKEEGRGGAKPQPVKKVEKKAEKSNAEPSQQGAGAEKTKRLNIYLTEAQHQELRILSVTTGEPAYQLCVDAMIKAGIISK